MKEKFLALEIGPDGTDGLFFSVDEDRSIILEKFVEGAALAKFLKSPARRFAHALGGSAPLPGARRRVIAAAHPSLATTIPIPLRLPREQANAGTKITLDEFENLIARAFAKIFNNCRAEAAKRLGAGELDTVLVGASAARFKMDGAPLRSPVGSAGKEISLILELTFAARRVFEALAPLFASPEIFYFAEAPQARLRALSRVKKPPVGLVSPGDGKGAPDGASPGDGAALYLLMRPEGDYDVLYREKLKWSPADFVRAVAAAFSVDAPTAGDLYRLYRRGEMSPAAARAFAKITEPPRAAFEEELGRKKVKGTIYLDVPHPPAGIQIAGISVEEPPVGGLLAELGFSLSRGGAYRKIMNDERRRQAAFRPLLSFIEAYFDRSDSPINRRLRHRFHWLAG